MKPAISSPALGLILGAIGVTIFGLTLPMTRIALTGFSPLFITFGRAVIASAVAGMTLFALGKRWPKGAFPALFLAGLCLVFGFPIFSSIAMQSLPAAHGGVVLGLLPLLTSIFAIIVDGERPSPLFWFCGIAGAALVVAFSARQSGFQIGSGDLWLVASVISASLGYVLSARLTRRLSGREVISWALVIMMPLSLTGAALTFSIGVTSPSHAAIGALAYHGLLSMFGGFVFWNAGLAIGGISRVAQIQLMQTFVTLLFSTILLGEHIGIETIIFAVAVAFVVWLGRKARIS
ncbi:MULTISPECIES: DMT family transporter [Alphaproteobacteria]|uniref:Multidrug DMT transporter permease n=2 Tax=Alphaproteobacteria TaxID=28211 RepID=A0A512HED3_9HYPH|nr:MULTISPECIES: DMT family transporter [Alphaproteobacteria]GEO83807.1 multidrug DMT transporter permease [Ciceribacter naphthalenivorans]GLR21315.1 multidrug DMT transporter permease [Ciceribacter naphthalenivorans]GLT04171.1 multidrug DMT transporter permease [Sphingomonas psychrolutea]